MTVLIKLCNDATAFADAIAGDGLIEVEPDIIQVFKIVVPDILKELGHGKNGPGIQPFGKIIAIGMKGQHIIGDFPDLLLKGLQVSSPSHLLQR